MTKKKSIAKLMISHGLFMGRLTLNASLNGRTTLVYMISITKKQSHAVLNEPSGNNPCDIPCNAEFHNDDQKLYSIFCRSGA